MATDSPTGVMPAAGLTGPGMEHDDDCRSRLVVCIAIHGVNTPVLNTELFCKESELKNIIDAFLYRFENFPYPAPNRLNMQPAA